MGRLGLMIIIGKLVSTIMPTDKMATACTPVIKKMDIALKALFLKNGLVDQTVAKPYVKPTVPSNFLLVLLLSLIRITKRGIMLMSVRKLRVNQQTFNSIMLLLKTL